MRLSLKTIILAVAAFAATSLNAANYWGYANLETCDKNVGIRYNSGVAQGAAIKITKEKAALLKGLKIEGLHAVFATSSGVSNIKIFVAKSLGGAHEVETSVSSVSPRFKDYKFDTPYTIAGDCELYVGFTLDYASDMANIFAVDKTAELPAGLVWGYTGEKWENVQSNGAPAFDLILDKMPDVLDVMVKPVDFELLYTAGKTYDFSGQLMNIGSKAITSVDLAIAVGDAEPYVQQLTGLNIAAGTVYDFKIEDYLIEHSGNLPVKIEAIKINGGTDADATDNVAVSTKYIYSSTFKRRVLLETFTGLGCSSCPSGTNNVLAKMNENPGKYVVVAHHTYGNPYGSDIFTMTEDHEYKWFFNGSQYAPGVMANRVPYSSALTNPVVELTDQGRFTAVTTAADQRAPYVEIDVRTSYDEITRVMTATVDVFTHEVPPYELSSLNVHLTQSGYTGYPQSGASTSYVHKFVFRGALTGAWGEKIELRAGEKVSRTYTYTVPVDPVESTSAYPTGYPLEVKPEDMTVVAFVGAVANKQTECFVYNVAEAPFLNGSSGITAPSVDIDRPATTSIYTIDGRKVGRMTEPGLYIVRTMQGGQVTTKKVLNK